MSLFILAGNKINLRDWMLADVEAYAHWLRPEHEWQSLDAPYYSKVALDQIPDAVAKKREEIEQPPPTPRRTLVIADAASDQLIGMVSWYWISEETDWLAQGIVIYDPAYWRRGIGYEALGVWGQYLFDAMPHIIRLDLRTWSGNAGMQALASKLGYVEEARFRKARIVNGEYFDGLGFGILREEWDARFPSGFLAQVAQSRASQS